MRRRIRVEYTWNGSSWLTTTVVRYIYDGNLVIQERSLSPQLLPQDAVTYTRGRDLSGSVQGAGGIGGLLARTDNGQLIAGSSSAHAYYHCDGNGNVTCLINTNQGIIAKYLYDPFGGVLSQSGPLAAANLARFSSKEFHPNSRLVYYLYRHFDPGSQRWQTRDPLGDASFFRAQIRRDRRHAPALFKERLKPAYAFVSNDAIDYIDPLGLNVYKVQLPSSVSGSVDHRQVVGDDGKGGCYILEFYPKKKCWVCLFGATLVGPGEVSVQMIKNQSASDYISANGLNVVATVDTDYIYFYPSGDSVDSLLAQDAAQEGQLGSPNYVLLWNDCGTIANSWLKHARDVVKQAEDSAPGGGDPGFPW